MSSMFKVSNIFKDNNDVLLLGFISSDVEEQETPNFYSELLNSKFQDSWKSLEFHELLEQMMDVFSCFEEKMVYIKLKRGDCEKSLTFNNKNRLYPGLNYITTKRDKESRNLISLDYTRQHGFLYKDCVKDANISEEEWNKELLKFASTEVDSMYLIIDVLQEYLYPNLVRVEKQLIK